MKKKALMSIVLLIIGASAVFAQTINGVWRGPSGGIISIYDGKGVWTEVNDKNWKEAEKRGNVGIGALAFRSIKSAGNLTWTGQTSTVNNRTYAVSWGGNVTFTVSPDGRTMQAKYQDGGSGTWTRIQ